MRYGSTVRLALVATGVMAVAVGMLGAATAQASPGLSTSETGQSLQVSTLGPYCSWGPDDPRWGPYHCADDPWWRDHPHPW